MKTKNEIIKEIKGQILIGGGETLVEAIYEIMNREMSQQKEEIKEEIKKELLSLDIEYEGGYTKYGWAEEVKRIIKKIGTFTPTCGYECEEEKGFQKGIIAEQNLIKSKIKEFEQIVIEDVPHQYQERLLKAIEKL